MTHDYDDIINLPHPISKRFQQMPMRDRAAQFAPFAALNVHSDVIKETSRFTETKIDISDSTAEILDRKLSFLENKINNHPSVSITFFQPDTRKKGGTYLTISGILKTINRDKKFLVFDNNKIIAIDSIIKIESELFPLDI